MAKPLVAVVRCAAIRFGSATPTCDADRTAAAGRGPSPEAGSHPASRQVPYAATATATLICLGLASSRIGSRTVSTPALYSALTLPASTVGGSANDRANGP